MACDITQADLGPLFAAVDPDVAAAMIEAATAIVAPESDWTCCNKNPCTGIKLAAKHLIVGLGDAVGAGVTATVLAERVADVSVTYANATSTSDAWSSTPYGVAFALMLGQVEMCQQRRSSMPLGVLGCL